MKTLLKIITLFAGIYLLTGCVKDLQDESFSQAEGQVTFSISTIHGEIEESSTKTRAIEEKPIQQLNYLILDKNDKIINPRWQRLAPDFSTLSLEGLKDGEYAIILFATTNPDTAILSPKVKDGEMILENPSAGSPLDHDYLFSRIDFTVDKENGSRNIEVALKRCVSRVEVDINSVYPYTAKQIKKVQITLSNGSALYTSKRSKKEVNYDGSGTITDFDITSERGFYTLPSKGAVSGTVLVQSMGEDSVVLNTLYDFTNIIIEEGKIAYIKIDWKSPDSNKGFFRVHTSDLTQASMSTMFLDNEPRSVFYSRSFNTNRPLEVSINNNHELHTKFYAPITLKDVTIWCRFNKYSPEFFKLAHYETIPPFSEIHMPVPLTDRPLTYQSADGRNIIIPAQPNLKNDDCEMRIETPHPYMAKIAKIAHPMTVTFTPAGADQGHAYWRHMTPVLCRHASILAVNMTFMFSSDYFDNKVVNWTGNEFKDDNGNIIPRRDIINRARSKSQWQMGLVEGVGGLASVGGGLYGIADYCYKYQYWNTEDKYSYAKSVIFHEFGHNMGYGHGGSMTYGDAWTVLGQEMLDDLGRAGSLPISHSDWESNYP